MQAWSWGQAPAAVPQGELLEDLKFRVEYLLWKDVAQAQLTLKSLGPGHYQAEISGEPLGLLKVIIGKRRDSYRTEMILRQRQAHAPGLPGRIPEERPPPSEGIPLQLRPGRPGIVAVEGRQRDGAKWHTALKGPIYDPLTAFYNCRLGLMGPIREGETFKVAGIPYPKPEEIEVRIGPETAEGRKIMIAINNKAFENDRGVIFAYLDEPGCRNRPGPAPGWARSAAGWPGASP